MLAIARTSEKQRDAGNRGQGHHRTRLRDAVVACGRRKAGGLQRLERRRPPKPHHGRNASTWPSQRRNKGSTRNPYLQGHLIDFFAAAQPEIDSSPFTDGWPG